MRYLVISDIHGNWHALTSVLRAASGDAIERILVLGDLVGYGASPNRVITRLRQLVASVEVVRGNHDKVVAGLEEDGGFNDVARVAARWTMQRLSAENREYLEQLPAGPKEVARGVVICHGSPIDEDEYVFGAEEAGRIFLEHSASVTFFGHTHIPTVLTADQESISTTVLEGNDLTLELDADKRYLINPGSVGQPRDRDPRAAYLIYDSDERRIIWRRQTYAVEAAQRGIVDAGLPEVLAYRLAAGL